MKAKIISLTLLFFSILICVCTSCTNEKDISEQYTKLLQENNSARVNSHRWFYFTDDGFKETDIPYNAPVVDMKPWTEAIRITSSLTLEDKSYLAVNKLGIIESPETFGIQKEGIASETVLIKEETFFSNASVGDLILDNNSILISFFTNQIFNESTTNELSSDDIVITSLNTETFDFDSILTKAELTTDNEIDFTETEIREVFFDNSNWHFLLKSNLTAQTDFSSLSASIELTESDSPKINIENQSVNHYRFLSSPKYYSELPNKIQDLLSPIPSSVSYLIEYYEAGKASNVQYQKGNYTEKSILGYVQSFDHCSIALFEDGTLFFAGKLPSQKLLNNGNSIAFMLPNLGEGFVYSNIALSGSTLIVGWEEKAFYKTGRSGFLAIDMEEVLYEE